MTRFREIRQQIPANYHDNRVDGRHVLSVIETQTNSNSSRSTSSTSKTPLDSPPTDIKLRLIQSDSDSSSSTASTPSIKLNSASSNNSISPIFEINFRNQADIFGEKTESETEVEIIEYTQEPKKHLTSAEKRTLILDPTKWQPTRKAISFKEGILETEPDDNPRFFFHERLGLYFDTRTGELVPHAINPLNVLFSTEEKNLLNTKLQGTQKTAAIPKIFIAEQQEAPIPQTSLWKSLKTRISAVFDNNRQVLKASGQGIINTSNYTHDTGLKTGDVPTQSNDDKPLFDHDTATTNAGFTAAEGLFGLLAVWTSRAGKAAWRVALGLIRYGTAFGQGIVRIARYSVDANYAFGLAIYIIAPPVALIAFIAVMVNLKDSIDDKKQAEGVKKRLDKAKEKVKPTSNSLISAALERIAVSRNMSEKPSIGKFFNFILRNKIFNDVVSAFGYLGLMVTGMVTAMATAGVIAGTAAMVATPIGWGLSALAAVLAIARAAYSIHTWRSQQKIKLKLVESIVNPAIEQKNANKEINRKDVNKAIQDLTKASNSYALTVLIALAYKRSEKAQETIRILLPDQEITFNNDYDSFQKDGAEIFKKLKKEMNVKAKFIDGIYSLVENEERAKTALSSYSTASV